MRSIKRQERPQATVRARHPWVRWHSRVGKWQAAVRLAGRTTHLGYFAWHCDALVAVGVWAQREHGSLVAAWEQRPARRRMREYAAKLVVAAAPEEFLGGSPAGPSAAPEESPSPSEEASLLATLERLEGEMDKQEGEREHEQ